MSKKRVPKQSTLVERTRYLLVYTEIPIAQIHKDLDIQYQWLMLFRDGKIAEPGASKIQAIYEYLTGSTLIPDEDLNAAAQHTA